MTIFLECLGAWNYELGLEVRNKDEALAFEGSLKGHFGKLIEVVELLKREEKLKDACYPFVSR